MQTTMYILLLIIIGLAGLVVRSVYREGGFKWDRIKIYAVAGLLSMGCIVVLLLVIMAITKN